MHNIFGLIKEGYAIFKTKKEPLLGAICHPALSSKILEIRKHIYTKILDLQASFAVTDEPVSYKDKDSLEYKPININEPWGDFFQCAWFNFRGEIPDIYRNQSLCAYIDVGGEGCVYDKLGAPQIGITGVLTVMDFLSASKGKHIYRLSEYTPNVDIWLDAGNNGFRGEPTGFTKLSAAYIATINESLLKVYYDYLVLFISMTLLKDKDREAKVMQGLKKVNSLLKKYTKEEIDEADKILSCLLDEKTQEDFELYAVGHSHLDLAWLWPIRETKRKVARTFSNQLHNLDRYDNYIYGASQPQQFEWAKELYPALYARIKEAVKQGRLEPQGGMWVEPDTNVIGAESMVRQVLYGKKFFKEEFNKDMRILWLPDVFGFSGALPQIIKKTGMEYFLTIKLNWNKINEFPYHSFIWEGIDDSKIIVHMPPEGTYCSEGSPLSLKLAHQNYKQKETGCGLLVYGVGDGGGGPGEGHIEALRREESLYGLPKVKFAPAIEFFDKLKESKDILPEVKGELYLETHQGTLTTQSNNKKLNRTIEYTLRNVELLATYASTKGYNYPKTQLDKIWKEVLLYHFHDIIPGSSINRVYVESVQRYKEMLQELEEVKADILSFLSSNKKGISVLNALPYHRREFIKTEDKWNFVDVAPFATAKLTPAESEYPAMVYGDRFIESDKYRLFFNRDGSIRALFEKSTKRNFAGAYLNKLTVYKDKKMFYDAWDIDINYTKKIKKYFRLVRFENIVDGPKVIRRNHYKFNKSTLIQDVVLTYEGDTVDFITDVDWNESHKMLRADFCPSVYSDKVTCNIQWGNIERSTKTDNKIDYAQHEVAAHKFVYVNSDNGGFTVLNNCKYGHRIKDGLISLNLLRSPEYPDKTADKGKHCFTYSVFAASGSDQLAKVTEEGYRLNVPLETTDYDIEFGSLITCDANNIVTETVKRSENGEGIVIRLYECCGKATTTEVNIALPLTKVFECDMLEQNPQTISLSALSFKPYEIKTILIKE